MLIVCGGRYSRYFKNDYISLLRRRGPPTSGSGDISTLFLGLRVCDWGGGRGDCYHKGRFGASKNPNNRRGETVARGFALTFRALTGFQLISRTQSGPFGMTFGIKKHEPHQGQTLEDVLEHELIKGNKSIQGIGESRSWGHEISWPKGPIGTFREPEYRPHDMVPPVGGTTLMTTSVLLGTTPAPHLDRRPKSQPSTAASESENPKSGEIETPSFHTDTEEGATSEGQEKTPEPAGGTQYNELRRSN